MGDEAPVQQPAARRSDVTPGYRAGADTIGAGGAEPGTGVRTPRGATDRPQPRQQLLTQWLEHTIVTEPTVANHQHRNPGEVSPQLPDPSDRLDKLSLRTQCLAALANTVIKQPVQA